MRKLKSEVRAAIVANVESGMCLKGQNGVPVEHILHEVAKYTCSLLELDQTTLDSFYEDADQAGKGSS